jgi:hypothetical protein
LILLFSPLDRPLIHTAPIPEHANGYEGYDQYGQGGEAWQTNENALPDGGGYDDGYPQGGQWGDQPGAQTEAWDPGQYPPGQYPPGQYPPGQYPQQGWAPPATSPVNTPQTPGPSAFAAWGRNPQDAYGAPRPPHTAPQPSPAAQPPMALPPRSRQDSGAAAGAPSWRNWGAEAMANSKNLVPPPPQPQGRGYGQQSRVAFASHDPYASFEDRADATPQTQHMIYDSITSSGVPKQPHQRPARGSAENTTHTGKHLKKSKKEKRAQGQSAPNGWVGQQDNPAWGQENPGWGQENTQWDQGGYGFDQQGADFGEKQDPAAGQWDGGQMGRDDLDSEGYADSDDWNDVTGRRNFRRTVSNAFVPAPAGNSPYPMASRTMAYANGTLEEDPLEAFSPGLSRKHNTMHDFADIELLESYGEALNSVGNALFGRDRKARDRIHWQFPFNKDERVRHALEWLHDYAHGVGAFGVSISFLHVLPPFSTTSAEQVPTNTGARCFVH